MYIYIYINVYIYKMHTPFFTYQLTNITFMTAVRSAAVVRGGGCG